MEEQHANDEAHSNSIQAISERTEPIETRQAVAQTLSKENDGSNTREIVVQSNTATETAPDQAKATKRAAKKIQWHEDQMHKT